MNLMNLMSREFCISLLRQGKNGEEILRILDSIASDITEETETTEETEI